MLESLPSRARRRLLRHAAMLAACAVPLAAMAVDDADRYPAKPIRLVVPYPAGGGTDMLARMVAQQMSDQWKQPVVVENIAGAGGQVGLANVARAAPDGYTIVLGITSFLQAPHLYKSLPYDIFTDFRPLSVLAYSSNLWLVPTDSPLRSLQDLVERARQAPGKMSYGSYGAGTSAHLHTERLNRIAGVDMTHVPYKGAAPLVNDVLGGHVDVGIVDVTTASAQVEGGKARALAVDGSQRVAIAPDTPTLAELGFDGFTSNGWFGFLAPAGTPEPIVQKLSAEINRIIASPQMQSALDGLSLRPGGTTPDEMAEIMQREGKAWEAMIEEVGLTLD